MSSNGSIPLEKSGVAVLADYLRRDLAIGPDKAEGVVNAVKRVPLHHPSLVLVRNQKRILANHIREFDTTVRALARGGTALPEELRSPVSSTPVSPSSSFSSSIPSLHGTDSPPHSAGDGHGDDTLPSQLYQCDDVHANVRVIRFPSLARLVSAQRVLKASYPRAFYVSPELRERLRTGNGLPQIPIGWAWVVVRTSLSEVEVERLDWFFYL
ncbi:hypothetical protein THASP1DRAFT_30057 [Thamnocephalis sphaerospora]|uniref:Uncharacterized protein n=1 Tax=Thamnocephalis sphaerospora TaxID=78915 RepID=A0A4P9XS24_9FUNG|nr:hypothetical protein THASP1DRAFT_30057 [Thamnocephalis sphaerospora]|eukprot:RKP08140.1 hypothetical protein THASP1DRAFT_30057 [Thamnocephalis sphaerospora]